MPDDTVEFTCTELLELQAELEELERTDPDVAAAAQSYDDVVRYILRNPKRFKKSDPPQVEQAAAIGDDDA